MIEHCKVSFGLYGVVADGQSKPGGGTIVRIVNSVITANGTGLAKFRGGQIYSYGNNVIDDNTEDGTPPVLIPLK
jgi:hypothetical protein